MGTPHLVLYVGFSATTMYHGPQPEETPAEWQEAVRHVLHTWQPGCDLRIRCQEPEILLEMFSDKFLSDLRHSDGYFLDCNQDVSFVKR